MSLFILIVKLMVFDSLKDFLFKKKINDQEMLTSSTMEFVKSLRITLPVIG